MTEALRKIIEYGFAEMTLNRIEVLIALDNTNSIKLVQKLGFKKEGILREQSHFKSKGKFEDSIIYSLLHLDYFENP